VDASLTRVELTLATVLVGGASFERGQDQQRKRMHVTLFRKMCTHTRTADVADVADVANVANVADAVDEQLKH
jgi:hypothetical protein